MVVGITNNFWRNYTLPLAMSVNFFRLLTLLHDISPTPLLPFFKILYYNFHFSRSLDRPRRSQTAMASDSSAACSDSEASTSYLNRASVPNLDKRDLQRAVAHLQETLQHRMGREQAVAAATSSGSAASGHSEVKAVVHRGPEAKTLDGQSIKQYESIKLNQYHLGPYETIKPSRLKRKGSASAAGATAGGGGQGDVATLDPSATKPPLMGPKPNLEKKRDSFEGHEEAVRTIVEAVQESRKQQQQQQQQQPSNSKRTNNSDTGT